MAVGTPRSSGREAAARGGVLNWLDEGLDWFERAVLVASIGSMAVVTIANVLARNLLGFSLQFADDTARMLLVIVTFMGVGYAARHARHIRVSALHDLLPAPARKLLLIFVSFCTSALLFVMAAYGWEYARSTRSSCRLLPEAVPALPTWLGVVLLLGALVAIGHLLRLAVERGGAWLSRRSPGRRRVLQVIIVMAVAGLAWLSWTLFMQLVEARSGRCRVLPSTGLPVYLVYSVVPLGLLLGGLQFLLAAIANLIRPDNYLSWHRPDEYESAEQAARQSGLSEAAQTPPESLPKSLKERP